MNKSIVFVWFFIICQILAAQENGLYEDRNKSHTLNIESGVLTSTQGRLPYWMEANSAGRFNNVNSGLFYSSVSHESIFTLKKDFKLFAGFESIARLEGEAELDIITSYFGVKNRKFSFYAGRFLETFGLQNSPLSVGSLIYGTNTRPLPKLVFQTNGWLQVPFIKSSNLEFKAYLAHGWFERERVQSGAYLHQKYLYGRLKLMSQKLVLSGGIHHNAQWGGTNNATGFTQPSGFEDYLRIFIGSPGDSDALQTDQQNALGNHLGNYEFKVAYEFKNFILSSHFQSLWEDASGLRPSNLADGGLGIQVEFKNNTLIRSVLMEVVSTIDQDAVKLNEDGTEYLEPDNFFNNSVYRSGWTYQGRVIGSPLFLLTDSFVEDGVSIQNMIRALRFGFSGEWKKLSYQVVYTSFENRGVFITRLDPPIRLNSYDLKLNFKQSDTLDFFTRLNYQDGNWQSGRNFGVQMGLLMSLRF